MKKKIVTLMLATALAASALTSEYGDQFSAEAAQYAVDHMSADWNANALASAENYSETMHMSKAGIYDQLTSEYGEKFTAKESCKAGFSACGGSLQRHNSPPPQCDPARKAFLIYRKIQRSFL